MKAIVVQRSGGPDVLALQQAEPPRPRPGEVVVRVAAAGVNFADTMMAAGFYPSGPKPPFTPGLEFAGTVEGTEQRVMGFTAQGAYAERIAVRQEALLPLPGAWSMEEGAAFPVNYFTAYFAYWMAALKAGDRVLIHAAAGGVGTAAVQMGRILKLETYGTSSSDDKLARLKELGLSHGINYRTVDYEKAVAEATRGEGVHAAFEMLGGEHTAKTTRCLRTLGRLIAYGTATGQTPVFDFLAMFRRNISVHALWLPPLMGERALAGEAFATLSAWIKEHDLRPVVGHRIPLQRAADAFRLLLGRRNYGKVVLTVQA
jgi:NADPH2:quinone reductase